MQNLILVGTAVTRPESIGSMYQMRPGGAWEIANGIPPDAAVQAITPHPTRDNLVFARSCRGVATSTDGGASWSTVRWDAALNECPCQASIVRYSEEKSGAAGVLLFANPDNYGELFGVVERTKMTVRLSRDDGTTWPVKRLIHAGPSSYSTLVQLSNGDIGILFEGGEKHRREWIRFARFSMAWLTGGEDQP